MRLTIWFEDGGIEEFDTSMLTTSAALGSSNVLSDLKIKILENKGMWAELSWYESRGHTVEDMPPESALRRAGCSLQLLNKEEVDLMRSAEMDGILQWIRIGPDLLDLRRLNDLLLLYYEPDIEALSFARKIRWLHDHLLLLTERLEEQVKESVVLERMGISRASYKLLSSSDDVVLQQGFDED